jgi:hypothetical protein
VEMVDESCLKRHWRPQMLAEAAEEPQDAAELPLRSERLERHARPLDQEKAKKLSGAEAVAGTVKLFFKPFEGKVPCPAQLRQPGDTDGDVLLFQHLPGGAGPAASEHFMVMNPPENGSTPKTDLVRLHHGNRSRFSGTLGV